MNPVFFAVFFFVWAPHNLMISSVWESRAIRPSRATSLSGVPSNPAPCNLRQAFQTAIGSLYTKLRSSLDSLN
jgi:hypothetical protein